MEEKRVGRPPAEKEFECLVRDIWTSNGRVRVGETISLPHKEVDELEKKQKTLITKLVAKK